MSSAPLDHGFAISLPTWSTATPRGVPRVHADLDDDSSHDVLDIGDEFAALALRTRATQQQETTTPHRSIDDALEQVSRAVWGVALHACGEWVREFLQLGADVDARAHTSKTHELLVAVNKLACTSASLLAVGQEAPPVPPPRHESPSTLRLLQSLRPALDALYDKRAQRVLNRINAYVAVLAHFQTTAAAGARFVRQCRTALSAARQRIGDAIDRRSARYAEAAPHAGVDATSLAIAANEAAPSAPADDTDDTDVRKGRQRLDQLDAQLHEAITAELELDALSTALTADVDSDATAEKLADVRARLRECADNIHRIAQERDAVVVFLLRTTQPASSFVDAPPVIPVSAQRRAPAATDMQTRDKIVAQAETFKRAMHEKLEAELEQARAAHVTNIMRTLRARADTLAECATAKMKAFEMEARTTFANLERAVADLSGRLEAGGMGHRVAFMQRAAQQRHSKLIQAQISKYVLFIDEYLPGLATKLQRAAT